MRPRHIRSSRNSIISMTFLWFLVLLTLAIAIAALVLASILTKRNNDGSLCPLCVNGTNGQPGSNGTGLSEFANFYGISPDNYTSDIQNGSCVPFPLTGELEGNIIPLTVSTFQLSDIGIYDVSWVVPVNQTGQLELLLNGVSVAKSIMGTGTTFTILSNRLLIDTTVVNSTLCVANPVGNTNITVTPDAGGVNASTAQLTILRIM